MLNLHIATIAIMAANVLVSLRGFNNMAFFDRYKFSISAIQAGQRERMATSGFLHVDFSHLFLNMFTLYFFAPVVSASRRSSMTQVSKPDLKRASRSRRA